MLRIFSAAYRHERRDNYGSWDEPYRKNVESPCSFFMHDGQNLHVVEGFCGDSHPSIGFPEMGTKSGIPFVDILVEGRVTRNNNQGSAATHPDLLTSEIFNKVVGDVIEEYGSVTMKWEWQGDWYKTPDLLEELDRYSGRTTRYRG